MALYSLLRELLCCTLLNEKVNILEETFYRKSSANKILSTIWKKSVEKWDGELIIKNCEKKQHVKKQKAKELTVRLKERSLHVVQREGRFEFVENSLFSLHQQLAHLRTEIRISLFISFWILINFGDSLSGYMYFESLEEWITKSWHYRV